MEPGRTDYIPPLDEALALPAPELAMRLLAYLVALEDHYGGYGVPFSALQLHPDAVASAGTWPEHTNGQHHELFLRAISEAWAWLVANGLLARRPGGGGTQEVFVTRTGREVAAQPDGLARLQAKQRLGVDLHPRLARKVSNQFLLGDHETAVFVAMKEVEIRVRELSGLTRLVGKALMQEAFKSGGPLDDPDLERSEQEGRQALFKGAISVFKNPSSHRQVDYDDPTVAAEAILFADLLLRLLDDITPRLPED